MGSQQLICYSYWVMGLSTPLLPLIMDPNRPRRGVTRYLPKGAAVWSDNDSSLDVITADISPSPLTTVGDCSVLVPGSIPFSVMSPCLIRCCFRASSRVRTRAWSRASMLSHSHVLGTVLGPVLSLGLVFGPVFGPVLSPEYSCAH